MKRAHEQRGRGSKRTCWLRRSAVDGSGLKLGVGGNLLDVGDLGVGLVPVMSRDVVGLERLELSENALQMAWFIINDSYRSDSCLLYSPHLTAITTIYLTLVLNPSAQATINRLLSSFSADKAAESSPHSTEDPGLRYLLLIPD
ncbi:hypothetical protein K435DRAFT_804286 [Dendrothele bispora CBS 962.96]|uniref:Uncharacterized protein n=1 Tax=Dendrothele bispora (strain CBS 962.96) TaxID=1314807 RepID=A0A4S8LEU2_DENBC|nr:hypothetical protein K435DRAFT_804286 [Dendrothele bispora CBS 962.96]